ncbi:MAG: hypothetical protein UZ14_CFX002000144 [Chloroflexi bacterium OLB14]|nr:MAG: hypothetical protein UZ14_CFX002000144 [Chloroflexi bacterium OLB14]
MNIRRTSWFFIFLWCWFMGITAIAIGFGAVFPSMNRIAKPLVCPRGEMELETEVYTPSPVETVTTLTWYCVDTTTGEKTEIGLFPMSLYTGTFYGFIFFAIVYVGIKKLTKPSDEAIAEISSTHVNKPSSPKFGETSNKRDTLQRMKELEQLRDANLITETEYEQKRAEILKGL